MRREGWGRWGSDCEGGEGEGGTEVGWEGQNERYKRKEDVYTQRVEIYHVTMYILPW